MNKLLKEPLFHFLVLGALVFAGYAALNRPGTPAPGRIVVSQGQIASMIESFALTRQRPPTGDELADLVRARVREEVYYREALALGMDKDDTVIRRRLRQKMEFVSDDLAAQSPPSDDELGAFLQAHPDKFRIEQKFTFRQVYLNPDKHGDHLAGDAVQVLEKLSRAGGDVGYATMGDPFVLESTFSALPSSEVARQFGQEFASKLAGLQPRQWQGPVESAFGIHLVFISERTEGRPPVLAEVRDAVRREWEDARRLETNEKFYQDLLKHYTVTIEPPAADTTKVAGNK